MKNDVSETYLKNAIEELEHDLGVKTGIDRKKLINEIKEENIEKAIKLITQHLKLPIKLKVEKGKDFKTSGLTNVKSHKQSLEGITAQVEIPNNIPLYGTKNLIDFPIKVKVSEESLVYTHSFAYVIAHEMIHVLLYSKNKKYKDNEFYTDLAVLMLGFKNIYKRGRKIIKIDHDGNKTIRKTKTYGYLDDNQFQFAVDKINSILSKKQEKKEELNRKIKKLEKNLIKYKRVNYRINNFVNYIMNNKEEISPEATKKMSEFLYFNQENKTEELIKKYNKDIKKIKKFYTHLNYFTPDKMEKLNSYSKKLINLNNSIERKINSIKANIKKIRKHINFLEILKTYIKSFYI